MGRVDIRGTGLISPNTCTKNHSHVELEPLKLDDVGLYMDFLGFCRVTRDYVGLHMGSQNYWPLLVLEFLDYISAPTI